MSAQSFRTRGYYYYFYSTNSLFANNQAHLFTKLKNPFRVFVLLRHTAHYVTLDKKYKRIVIVRIVVDNNAAFRRLSLQLRSKKQRLKH